MPICKICGKDSFWTVDVASKICNECKKKNKRGVEDYEIRREKEQSAQKQLEKKKQTLSQKYNVLKLYKGLAVLIMIVNTGWTLYSLVQINDVSKEMEKYSAGGSMDNAMLTMIVTYVITMFSLFCLTKMIDFLFDLDLNKSNK